MRRGDTPGPWERTEYPLVFVRAISNVRNKHEFARGVIGYESGLLREPTAGHVMCPTCFWSFAPYKSGNLRRHDCARPTLVTSRVRSGGIRQLHGMLPRRAAATQAAVNALHGGSPVATLALPGVA